MGGENAERVVTVIGGGNAIECREENAKRIGIFIGSISIENTNLIDISRRIIASENATHKLAFSGE